MCPFRGLLNYLASEFLTLQARLSLAIKFSANYRKKLGLPQFSSHSFSASVEVELNGITQMAGSTLSSLRIWRPLSSRTF